MAIKKITDLEVYRLAYSLAMEISRCSIRFPKEEVYSIREGYAKRKYENVFFRHLNDALGSSEETRGWLRFAQDCGYLEKDECVRLDKKYDHVNAMLYRLTKNWKSVINQ
ncbi:MAG: four helix bundle protein [Desulfosarcina sp.]|nr:four helix bundle protein [Desulfosarcina sp.]MBC2768090.1 four helix bundle protein [Desulfosarcina sp.]